MSRRARDLFFWWIRVRSNVNEYVVLFLQFVVIVMVMVGEGCQRDCRCGGGVDWLKRD